MFCELMEESQSEYENGKEAPSTVGIIGELNLHNYTISYLIIKVHCIMIIMSSNVLIL